MMRLLFRLDDGFEVVSEWVSLGSQTLIDFQRCWLNSRIEIEILEVRV